MVIKMQELFLSSQKASQDYNTKEVCSDLTHITKAHLSYPLSTLFLDIHFCHFATDLLY
jgi:hypothetical protein